MGAGNAARDGIDHKRGAGLGIAAGHMGDIFQRGQGVGLGARESHGDQDELGGDDLLGALDAAR